MSNLRLLKTIFASAAVASVCFAFISSVKSAENCKQMVTYTSHELAPTGKSICVPSSQSYSGNGTTLAGSDDFNTSCRWVPEMTYQDVEKTITVDVPCQ